MYYFYGYFQAKKQALASGLGWSGQVQFCVPSGNFGNALACYYAQQMGVPISKIVVATNANDILHRYALLFLLTSISGREGVVRCCACVCVCVLCSFVLDLPPLGANARRLASLGLPAPSNLCALQPLRPPTPHLAALPCPHRFFAHGDFTKAAVQATLAPAMDITIPSNFERFLFHHAGNNPAWLCAAMETAKDTIGFTMGVTVPGRARTLPPLFDPTAPLGHARPPPRHPATPPPSHPPTHTQTL